MSVIEPIVFTFPDKTTMTVRSASVPDSVPLLELIREILDEKDHFGLLPEEFQHTDDSFQKLIGITSTAPADLYLVAEISGKPIGFLEFYVDERRRLAHSGTFTLFIKKQYRLRGVGTLLLGSLIDWGQANPAVEKILLTLLSNNAPAVALYRKMGFEIEGRRSGAVKMAPEIYLDEILMARSVK